MKICDMLLCVDPARPGSSVIDNAVKFAKKQEANLIGLYALELYDFPGYVQAQLPKEVLDNYRSIRAQDAEKAEADFQAACTSAGIHWDWRCIEGERAQTVIDNGRLSDLVLLAGGNNGDEAPTGESSGRIILECGRPVLLLPPTPIPEDTGSRVLLAWNGRREAVRAVHDAMPLLTSAEWVEVVMVNPDTGSAHSSGPPGSELCRHLARHGVKAEARQVKASGRSDGDALLALAEEENLNLIVMGAYGHARWRELVIGGVTAHVLRHSTLPVLLSH